MPRFAANLTLLFTESPALARPALAQAAGFAGVEILFPYDHKPVEWAAVLNGMALALINTPPGDWAFGERGFAAVPGAEARFRNSFLQALDYATRLKSACVHIMAGVAKGPVAEDVFRENIAWAATQAPEQALMLEPLNPKDMPGYFLNDYDQAARLLDDLALPNLGLQFDLWHAAHLHGDAADVWARHGHRVGHIQIAGFPDRSEPGGGGFDLRGFLAGLDAQGYDGWVAAEYRPKARTAAGLGWLAALRTPGLIGG
ncbi:MAG: TIM barrel protein [Pseudorhodobacter sp.]|nr:TIM barrel protein [Pseudorhodobacter sp.]